MTDVLATVPATKPQASTERLKYALDVTSWLLVGEVPATPVVTLVDLATNLAYPEGLNGDASFAGNVLTTPWVEDLLPGHSYTLVMSFAPATGKTLSPVLRIECPR